MKKILGILGKIACWYLVLMFVIMMFVGGASTILFGLAALLVAPVGKLKDLKKKLNITPKLTVGLTITLLFAGVLLAPTVENEPAIESGLKTESLDEKQTYGFKEELPIIDEQEEIAVEEQVVEEELLIPENSTFSIRFLDMGQADASLIECDGHYMLIDGGNRDSASKMYAILKDAGIEHLDLIVGTHPDEDHIGGLAGALNYANADVTLCSTTVHDTETFEDFVKYANLNGGGIIVPKIGDLYLLGSSKINIVGVNGGSELNDTSIILKIEYGETSFLFTGDAEATAEQAVLDSGADISATVLKVGHHGSADSTTEAFLNKVMPEYAIISVGAENTYLHPTNETLNRLKKINAEIYRTDLQGEITINSDGESISITTEKESSEEEIMISGEEAASIAKAQLEAEEKAKAEEKARAEAEAKAKLEAEEKAKEETLKTAVYTYSALDTKMYASQSVNVRSLPNTDGEKLGGLSYSQEVVVTGKCTETGWYRIVYQGKEGYVSDKYLTNEKPVQNSTSQSDSSSPKDNSSTGVTAPSGTDYVLNTNTRKFHYPSCRSVKQMKAKNTAYYNGTRDEVIAKGYDPCGNCHP